MDAAVYAVQAQTYFSTTQSGKSQVQRMWAADLAAQIAKTSTLSQMIGIWSNMPRAHGPDPADLMRTVLKRLKSKHLPGYMQMSSARRLHFIERVERHGVKQHPNQQHMRDIHAAFKAEQVYHALKD